MTCSDCATNLDHTPGDQPCPTCGGVQRSAIGHAAVASAVGFVSALGVSVGYGPNRPWQQKWHDVMHGLEELEATYREDGESNDIVRRRVEDFFEDCRELADWLKQSANRPEAMSYVNTDSDLKLCDGMAQTTKHHTRKPTQVSPDPITARITRVDSGFGVKAEIGWSSHFGRSGTEDSLDLARRCIGAWRRFFEKYNLDPSN